MSNERKIFYAVMGSIAVYLMYMKYKKQSNTMTDDLQAVSTASSVTSAMEMLAII